MFGGVSVYCSFLARFLFIHFLQQILLQRITIETESQFCNKLVNLTCLLCCRFNSENFPGIKKDERNKILPTTKKNCAEFFSHFHFLPRKSSSFFFLCNFVGQNVCVSFCIIKSTLNHRQTINKLYFIPHFDFVIRFSMALFCDGWISVWREENKSQTFAAVSWEAKVLPSEKKMWKIIDAWRQHNIVRIEIMFIFAWSKELPLHPQ